MTRSDGWRYGAVLGTLAVVVALPFWFRRAPEQRGWREGDPVVVVITPHNEAIRHEYGAAFSRWHLERFGQPVKVDWRNIGGTSEIVRYLKSEMVSSYRAWCENHGTAWPSDGESALLGGLPAADGAHGAFLAPYWATDDASAFGTGMDLCFGGGAIDLSGLAKAGILVPVWTDDHPAPPGIFATADGREIIPAEVSGETWRAPAFYGATLSTFGICYNRDRMAALGIAEAPLSWKALGEPAWRGTVGLADPTKSGSVAKAFETILQVACRDAVERAGFLERAAEWEDAIAAAGLPPGEMPPEVPAEYQAAVEEGWGDGLRLIRRIGANARYFTDSASKVPLDVGAGNASAGICIDFYGLFEAEIANGGREDGAMDYATPPGESGVSADPIGRLRGAPHPELAERFVEFLLSPEGQQIWCYRVGEPGGPESYALLRAPVRRDFYPSADPEFDAEYRRHREHTSRDLGTPTSDAFALAARYVYHARWSGRHFSFLRDFIRAMCLDSGQELRAAWGAICEAGGPEAVPEATAAFEALPREPEPVAWGSALGILKRHDRQELLRDWTAHFRRQYREAERLAKEGR